MTDRKFLFGKDDLDWINARLPVGALAQFDRGSPVIICVAHWELLNQADQSQAENRLNGLGFQFLEDTP